MNMSHYKNVARRSSFNFKVCGIGAKWSLHWDGNAYNWYI